jgi:hypothetical protein
VTLVHTARDIATGHHNWTSEVVDRIRLGARRGQPYHWCNATLTWQTGQAQTQNILATARKGMSVVDYMLAPAGFLKYLNDEALVCR